MTDVATFHKPGPIECGCGCGATGSPRRRPWRDGVVCVRNACRCRRCLGGRSKASGQRRQSKATTALGVPRSSIHPGHEEFLPGAIRIEVKSGAQVVPAWTAYRKAEEQSEAARPIGDNRPFVASLEPKGENDGLVVFRRSKILETVAALAEQLGLIP